MNLAERQIEAIIEEGFPQDQIKPPTKSRQIKDNLAAVGGKLVGWLVLDVPLFTIPTVASYIFLSHLEPFKNQPLANTAISVMLGLGAYHTVLSAIDVFIYEIRRDHGHF